MKIISLNVNGIRSALKKELLPWLISQNADVICLQEIKAHLEDIPAEIRELKGFHNHFFPAQKKGYSGVALLSRKKPDRVQYGLGWNPCDDEGRFILADFGNLSIASIYLPSGSAGEHRQAEKFKFMDAFTHDLTQFKKSKRDFILCGDWNIAHHEIDLKNWRSNQKNSGFLPEERAWLTKTFNDYQLVDGFRSLYPEKVQYSWWSQRGQAYAKDVGWRIDYHVLSQGAHKNLLSMDIPRDPKFSDHAPVIGIYQE